MDDTSSSLRGKQGRVKSLPFRPMKTTQTKKLARERVERAHEALIGLSHWIHANPELGYEEFRACGWVAEWLEKAGFEVERGVGGLATAVDGRHWARAAPRRTARRVRRAARSRPRVRAQRDRRRRPSARRSRWPRVAPTRSGFASRVLGTPAEEGGGGKILLLERGAFEGVHCALMIHPGPVDQLLARGARRPDRSTCTYHGK